MNMKKQLLTLSLISMLSIGVAACNKADTMAPGHYEHENVSTNSNGTETVNRTSTNVNEDAYGNKTAVTTHKTTTDPKGLFNKSTNSSTDVEQGHNY